jgi:site-specific DNA recombinase
MTTTPKERTRYVPKDLPWGDDWDLGVLYLRISDDPEGLELGVLRQYEDGHELAWARKIRITKVYCDNDIGASTRSKKPRPDYADMVKCARVGEFKWILSYSNSRLTRRPMELEDLITLHEQAGTKLLTKVSGEADLATADGRMMARVMAAFDAGEAERTGERVARKHVELARDGKLCGGIRPFGWQDDQVTLDPVETGYINDAVDMLLNGTATQGLIVRVWNELGIYTPFGNRWRPTSFRKMLEKPRLAGIRVFRQQVQYDDDGKPVMGVWEPLMDYDKWQRLRVVLQGRPRKGKGTRPGAAKYLQTTIVRCGKCMGRMFGNPGQKKQPRLAYVCSGNPGCTGMSISMSHLDHLVQKLVLAKIHSSELPDASQETTWEREGDLQALRTDKGELMAALTSRRLSAATVIPAVEDLDQQIEALETERTEWVRSLADRPTKVEVTDVAEFEKVYDIMQRRATLQKWLTAVVVRPGRKGYNFEPGRVEPVWRELPRSA